MTISRRFYIFDPFFSVIASVFIMIHVYRKKTSTNSLAPPKTKDGKVFSRNKTAPSILSNIPEDKKGFYTINYIFLYFVEI